MHTPLDKPQEGLLRPEHDDNSHPPEYRPHLRLHIGINQSKLIIEKSRSC